MSSRVALVTGASSGIGFAITGALAARHQVAMCSSDESRLRKAAGRVDGQAYGPVRAYRMDVRSSASVQESVGKIVRDLGRIDVLVNCAGVADGGRTLTLEEDTWRQMCEVNLTGLIRTTNAVLSCSGMLERGWGRVINIASTGGKQGVVYGAYYSASKHGVVGFSKSLGLELAKTGVTVNAICPGFVETPMAAAVRDRYARAWGCTPEEARARIEARIPLGRYIRPDEVAEMVVYLTSDGASAVVAQALNICGGLGTY